MKMYQLVPVDYLQRLVALQQKYEPDTSAPDPAILEKKEPPEKPIFYDEYVGPSSSASGTSTSKSGFQKVAEEVIGNMPKRNQRMAREILQHLLLAKGLKVDLMNRLVYADGSQGSLLYVLLSHAVLPPQIRLKMKSMPPDWPKFSALLPSLGAPENTYDKPVASSSTDRLD